MLHLVQTEELTASRDYWKERARAYREELAKVMGLVEEAAHSMKERCLAVVRTYGLDDSRIVDDIKKL